MAARLAYEESCLTLYHFESLKRPLHSLQKNYSSSSALSRPDQMKGYFRDLSDCNRSLKVQMKPLKRKLSWEDLKKKRELMAPSNGGHQTRSQRWFDCRMRCSVAGKALVPLFCQVV